MLALLWRALRWRRAASLAVLVAGLVASAAAALGPMYARSAEESLVVQRVAAAPAVQVGITVTAQLDGPPRFTGDPGATLDPSQVAAVSREVALDPRLARWFGPPSTRVEIADADVVPGPHGERSRVAALGGATLLWTDRACDGLVLVEGSCSPGPGEAVVSQRTAQTFLLEVGSVLTVRPAGVDPVDVRVVGIWSAPAALDDVWGGVTPQQWAEPPTPKDRLRLDALVVGREVLDRRGLQGRTVVYRPLVRDRLVLGTAGTVVAAVDGVRSDELARQGVHTVGTGTTPPLAVESHVGDLVAEVAPQRAALRAAALAVTAQLVLLTWYVLFLVVSATTEERSAEVALAKLRGLSPVRTAVLALAETALLLVVAAPLGLAVAYGVDSALARTVLDGRVEASVRPPVLVGLAAAVLGGLAAAALATRGLLRAKVVDQLRRTGGERPTVARSVAVDAVVVALAAEGVYLLRSGVSASVALVTPALLALAAGLVGVRLLPLVARLAVRRTRDRGEVAGFLAARNLARRPAGGRVAVLLAVAVALVVFGVQEWRIAQLTRADLARADVPAARVVHVTGADPLVLRTAVRSLDPDGRWALAAVRSAGTLAVDSPRLAAVSQWDPRWAGTSADRLVAALRPAAVPPVVLRGDLRLTLDDAVLPATTTASATVTVIGPDGDDRLVAVGRLSAGERTYRVRLPECARGDCRLSRIAVDLDPFSAGDPSGRVVVTGVADDRGPVEAGLTRPGAWRVALTGSTLLDPSRVVPDDVRPLEAGLGMEVRDGGIAPAAVADHPEPTPALLGDRSDYTPFYEPGTFRAAGLDGQQLPVTAVPGGGRLPIVGRSGALVDLGNAVDASVFRNWPGALDSQVWLSPAAPADVLTRLSAAGLVVGDVDVLAERRAELDRDGISLALVLYLVSAVTAILAGGGAMVVWSVLGARRRAYELAAARMLGASRRSLVRAGFREQLVLALLGTVTGAAVGVAGTLLVLDALPAISGGTDAPTAHGVQWPWLAAVVGGVLVVLVLSAQVGARRVVATADTDLLRQVQA